MSQSRTKNSLRNIIVAFGSNLFITILSFFTSRVIKDRLGLEILGLNGVFSNIISVLSLSELGIGTAITFALYKPLAERDEKLIKSLMQFYKRAYKIVAATVAGIGLLLFPFLKFFVKSNNYSQYYIIEVYLLFLLNSVISYFFVYKRTLIIADQKNYIITTITLVYTYVLKISQFIAVFFTSNYILYLIVNVICTFVYNLAINITCNKLYPYLKDTIVEKLPEEVKNAILKKIKALFLHSVGTVVTYATDNILISYFCGIEEAGRYSSYAMIVTIIGNMLIMVFDNIKDSVGNFLVCESENKHYELFKKILFVDQSLTNICSICLLLLMTPFVTLWLGKDAVIPFSVVLIMVLNFNFSKNTAAISVIRNAAGVYEPDRWAPLIQSLINLVTSIICAHYMGLLGIVLGTLISGMLVPNWCGPYVIFRCVFHKGFFHYVKEYSIYLIRAVFVFIVVWFVFNKCITISTSNILFFLLYALAVFLLSCFLWGVSVIGNTNAKYFLNIIQSKIFIGKKKIRKDNDSQEKK